jgi:Fe-S-cluster containining protein
MSDTPETVPLYTTVECGRCGVCCTEPIVPVTDSDVLRLCTALKKPAEQIVRFWSMKEMEYDPEAELWIKFPQGKRAMGLRKRYARCMFLTEDKCCSVYLHRPMTCRTFPYAIDLDENDVPETVKLNKIVSCSCKRKKRSDLREIIDNVRTELNQDDLYFDKVIDWNKKKSPGGTKEFLKYLGLISW